MKSGIISDIKKEESMMGNNMDTNSEIEYAKSVLQQEISGINSLIDSLRDNFIAKIDLLYRRKEGHVI